MSDIYHVIAKEVVDIYDTCSIEESVRKIRTYIYESFERMIFLFKDYSKNDMYDYTKIEELDLIKEKDDFE